jgi:hypothetical protein
MPQIDSSFSAVTNTAGVCTVNITTGARVRDWTVYQISVEMLTAPVGSGGATCFIRKNGALITQVLATADAAAGDPPVQLNANDTLSVVWTGATPGDVGKVLAIYDDGR